MLGRRNRDHSPGALLERAAAQFGNAPLGNDGIDVRTRSRDGFHRSNDPAAALWRSRRQGNDGSPPSRRIGSAHKIKLPSDRANGDAIQRLGVDAAVEADFERGIDRDKLVDPRQNGLIVRV